MTVIPDKHTFTIWQGASFIETLAIYTDAAGVTPKDLTGYTASMIIRDKPNGTVLITMTDANGKIAFTDRANGKLTLQLTPAETDPTAITWKGAVYDLTITKTSTGVTDALLYGAIKVQGV